ncbi:MAG: RNA polymerase sigma factor [Myxococcota bacterium]
MEHGPSVTEEARPSATSAERPDGELVRAAVAGDSQAMGSLYERHARMLYGLAFRLVARADVAEDLVQDAFVKAFERLPKLKNPQAFEKWVSTILVRDAYKKLRRRGMLRKLGLARDEPVEFDRVISSSAPPGVAAELKEVYNLVESMDTDVRMAFLLRRVEGLTVPEISERLGMSESTVKRRLQVALDKLEALKR